MRTVIIGAGQAGAWVARSLRAASPVTQITLLGQETHAPYERPPLSKGVLAGRESAPPCLLSPEQLAELQIDFQSGTTVTAIDRVTGQVECANGQRIGYDKLVIATGGRARQPRMPGAELPGVHTLRSWSDCQTILAALQSGRSLLVLGGGWIGLEVAATARRMGLNVTLVEDGERLCARSVPIDISLYLMALHEQEGVEILLNTSVGAIRRHPDGRLIVDLGQGERVADLIVAGIGLEPNIELAVHCGLEINNGIVVNSQGQTSDSNIYAVGDVANQPCVWIGAPLESRLRLESWANAQNQAIAVGRVLADESVHYDEIPWFWSDQYDMNLQVLGLPDSEGVHTLRGSKANGRFCVFQTVAGKLRSVIAVNMARELKVAKRWMVNGSCPSATDLANMDIRLDKV